MAELRSLGWNDEDLTAVDNPSVDSVANKSDVKPNALVADIRNLRSILSRLIEEQGRNVLVVAHSYGGTPALSACQDLWQHVRQQQAKSGGVIRVGLIASSLTLPGSSVAVDRSSWQEANGIPPDTAPEGVEIVDGVCKPKFRGHQAALTSTLGTNPDSDRLRTCLDERYRRSKACLLSSSCSSELRFHHCCGGHRPKTMAHYVSDPDRAGSRYVGSSTAASY